MFKVTIKWEKGNHEQRKSNHQKLTKEQEDICNFCNVPQT